jgi:hypothetical protein
MAIGLSIFQNKAPNHSFSINHNKSLSRHKSALKTKIALNQQAINQRT